MDVYGKKKERKGNDFLRKLTWCCEGEIMNQYLFQCNQLKRGKNQKGNQLKRKIYIYLHSHGSTHNLKLT